MKTTLFVIGGILLMLIITNPSKNAFKEYLGVSEDAGLKRNANFFICSKYSRNDLKYFAIAGNFFKIDQDEINRDSAKMAQRKNQIVRIAKIEVDSAQLKNYNAALNEQMKTAVREERGVLTYYALADKDHPSHITILEIYADSAAYLSHVQTAHFKKYKTTVEHMVKSLELVNVDIIGVAKNRECNLP